MSRITYVEPPIDEEYTGPTRKCSCGCEQVRPATKEYFGIQNVSGYRYLHPVRKVCRNKEQRIKRKRAQVLRGCKMCLERKTCKDRQTLAPCHIKIYKDVERLNENYKNRF